MNPRSIQVEKLLGGFRNMGHRGAKGLAPENTLASFKAGLEHTDCFELDTFLCGSGELIVLHDETLDRTTNGKGFASKQTWDQIKNLDAGSHFNTRYSNERIPLLRELLTQFSSQVLWDIELKSSESEKERINLTQSVVSLISDLKMENQVFLSSFDEQALYQIKLQNPNLIRGLLLEKGIRNFSNSLTEPDILLPHFSACDSEFMKKANNLPVIPYTVNEESDWKKLMDLGVKGIITDYPDKLKKYLDKLT